MNYKPLHASNTMALSTISKQGAKMSKMEKGKMTKLEQMEKEKHDKLNEILDSFKTQPPPPPSPPAAAANRWGTVRERYDQFCDETSFTALSRIHKATNIYKRLAWLVLCLGMLTWLSVQCYWLLAKYFKYPVEVKIELVAVPEEEFPSVTVCNLNPLKEKNIAKGPFAALADNFCLDEEDKLYKNYLEDMEEEMESNENETWDPLRVGQFLKEREFNKWDSLENDSVAEEFYNGMDESHEAKLSFSSLAAQQDPETLESYGHQIKDLLISCSWKGMACSPSNFTYMYNAHYGNCYTFNSKDSGQSPLKTSYAGPYAGLVLEMNIEQDDYIAALSPSAGVRVTIHKRGTYPFPEDDGVSIPPGHATSLALSKRLITRLPDPHGDCGQSGVGVTNLYTTEFNVEYTKQTCIKSCYQDVIQTICGCAHSMFYVPKGATVCGENATECLEYEIWKEMETCNSKCPSPCEESKFEHMMGLSAWPSKKFSDNLSDKIMKTSSDFLEEDDRENSGETLVKLEVYYKELLYEHIEEQKAYESQNLISDIGGQLGLWLGLSAITVGELVEFLAAVGKLAASKMFNRKQNTNSTCGPKSGITKVKPYKRASIKDNKIPMA